MIEIVHFIVGCFLLKYITVRFHFLNDSILISANAAQGLDPSLHPCSTRLCFVNAGSSGARGVIKGVKWDRWD